MANAPHPRETREDMRLIWRSSCAGFVLVREANQSVARGGALQLRYSKQTQSSCANAQPRQWQNVRDLIGRGNVDAGSRVLPNLVAHRAHRKSEHARGVG